MLAGMGTVFVFLTLLVIATSLMSRALMRAAAEPPSAPGPGGATEEEVAAISAALTLHRKNRGPG